MANPAVDAELRDLIENHLGQSRPEQIALAGVCVGLGRIGAAFERAQDRPPNWGAALGELKRGIDDARAVLPMLKSQAGLAPLVGFAERQVAFAQLLRDEIVRLQAGESTLV
jgi:hypothetical protein